MPLELIISAFEAALARAEAFVGATAPNPPVGCVILDAAGNTLACEAHAGVGSLHAEALAIDRCREADVTSKIHTMVVTLEPCNHHGRTPPCVDAILSTPARRVWIGAEDPNPAVRGGGATRLAEAGLEVSWLGRIHGGTAASLATECQELIGPFSKRVLSGLPWVTVKQALDASGSMIPPPGQTTFASPPSLDLAHSLRRRADAILTGSGTILADEPLFTVRRVADHPGKSRTLVIMDRRGRTPAHYLTAASSRGFKVQLATDLEQSLRELSDAGALEVLIEAGPNLTGAVLESELWDERYLISVNAIAEGHDSVERVRRLSRKPTG